MYIRGLKYETPDEADAVAWITRQAGQPMKRCVFPTRPSLDYYISGDGIMYGCIHCPNRHKHIAYPMALRTNGKSGCPVYRMYTANGTTSKLAARLIWCTWVLGYWSDKVKVRYKDGDKTHIDLANLAELNNEWKIREEHAENMRKYEDIYRREFKLMVHFVRHKMGILEEEAKDAVQDAYIAVTRNHDGNMQQFGANWMVMAQKIAMSYIQQKDTFRPIDYVPNDRATGRWDTYHVTPVLAPIKDATDRRIMMLVADGASQREIGEELGISLRAVVYRLHNARAICQRYLRSEAVK